MGSTGMGSTGATASTGSTGATATTGASGVEDTLPSKLDEALKKLMNGRGSIRRKSGVSVIKGLKAGAEAENMEAERELRLAMARDAAAKDAAKAAAKARLVRHLKALVALHRLNVAKAAKKLMKAKSTLSNLTDAVAPLKDRLETMRRSLEYAKEKGLGSSKDEELMKPLAFKIKALRVKYGK